MNNKEYLIATLSRFGLSEAEVQLIILNQTINEVEEVNVQQMKMAMYNEFSNIIPLADVSEGGYSVRWNLAAVRLWYSQLAEELGQENKLVPPPENTINDASWRW